MLTNKKAYIIIGLFVLSTSFPLFSQAQDKKQNHPIVLEKTSFLSNCYIEGIAGNQILYSTDAARLSFEKRQTPSFAIALGKWFSPFWGLRLQLQGYSLDGYTNVYGNFVGDPESGFGPVYGSDDPVRNYVTINPDGSYRYYVRYLNLHADFQVSLFNLLSGYDETRCWDLIPAFGLGCFKVFNYKGVPASTTISTNISLSGLYRLNKEIDLKMEVQSAILPDIFDGRITRRTYENNLALMFGISYRFNPRGYKQIEYSYPKPVIQYRTDTIVKIQKVYIQQAESVPAVQSAKNVLLCSISFNVNSCDLDESQNQNLYNAANYLNKNPKSKLRIIGYADRDTGTSEYNFKLGQNRAKSVYDYLINKLDVASERLELEAYGDQLQPYEINHWNRVVNIIVVP